MIIVKGELANGRMVVGISIVDAHVFEKPFDMLVEEALNFSVIKFRINKEGAYV